MRGMSGSLAVTVAVAVELADADDRLPLHEVEPVLVPQPQEPARRVQVIEHARPALLRAEEELTHELHPADELDLDAAGHVEELELVDRVVDPRHRARDAYPEDALRVEDEEAPAAVDRRQEALLPLEQLPYLLAEPAGEPAHPHEDLD